MLDSFQASQGLVLREIIVGAARSVSVSPYNRFGRLDAYIFDKAVGVSIRYSTKRLSPWPFTFHIAQVSELLDLEVECRACFASFVCGIDEIVTIDMATLHELVSFKANEQAWLRIARKPRSLYSLVGNRAVLNRKVPRGATPIIDALRELRAN